MKDPGYECLVDQNNPEENPEINYPIGLVLYLKRLVFTEERKG